tara:strand:- start:9 stop:236 length:228 start_codon:yes stop_codon:yes gene_type:complete
MDQNLWQGRANGHSGKEQWSAPTNAEADHPVSVGGVKLVSDQAGVAIEIHVDERLFSPIGELHSSRHWTGHWPGW